MEERGGILINGWKNRGGEQRVDEQGGDLHQRGGGDPQCRDGQVLAQVLEMLFCSYEMEMKSKISIIIKTGFRPL